MDNIKCFTEKIKSMSHIDFLSNKESSHGFS